MARQSSKRQLDWAHREVWSQRSQWSAWMLAPLALTAAASVSTASLAAEGGVSFWLPGVFGSLAAAPQQPGFSLATFYYHTAVSADGNVSISRQISSGNITANLTGNLNRNLQAKGDIGFAVPTYVFASPVLGGQAAISAMVPYGRAQTSVDSTFIGTLGPNPIAVSGGRTDTVTGFGDIAPQFSLRWNAGVNNYMTYITGGIPVESYDSKRFANLGFGHGAIDVGGGYTYFNPGTGREFSGVLGVTYNLENPTTHYQNGVETHFDWGVSQFVGKQWQFGLVGYAFQQLTGDSGAGAKLGDFKSRVIGVGPQVGYIFPLGNLQGKPYPI